LAKTTYVCIVSLPARSIELRLALAVAKW